MSEDRVGIELSIDLGGHQRPVQCRVTEAASELTHAVVEIASNDDLDVDAALGSEATLVLTLGERTARRWTLLVGSIEFSRMKEGSLRYDVHLHARPWLLRHTRDTRKFQGLSAQQIVTKVLSDHGVAHAWQVTRATRERDYCVQYGESDLDFVSRLLEQEGIYYGFDEGGVMVLEDRSSAAAPVEGGTSSFELLDAAGALQHGELGVFAFRRGARVAPGRVTVNDVNWKSPRRPLLSSSSAERDQALEVYDYPSGFREPAEGELLARMRLEAHRVRARFVEGAGNVPTFAPGRSFSFGAAGGEMFAGDYFLVGVEHEAHAVDFFHEARGEATPYRNRFRAIPASVPFRPELRTPRPTVSGSHTAMVRGPAGQEIHTDEHGRFRAQFHWDREATGSDQDSRWIRPLQEVATSMTLARVGWEMSVAYVDGDPERPVGVARNINGVMPPAYAQPASRNAMTIKTPSSPATGGYNEIKLDDSAGAMRLSVRAERDYAAEVKQDKTETVGHDETRDVGGDLQHVVGRDQRIHVGHDSTETIGKDRVLQVKGARTKTVAGSETVDVGANLTVSTVQDEIESVGSVRMTFAGGFQMPDLAARAKAVAKGLVPDPKAIAQKAASAALGGAQKAAGSAFEASGGLASPGWAAASAAGAAGDGALAGAQGSLTQSLENLVPSPSGIADKLTGGLSSGVTFDKLADQLLVGSIRRTATDRTSRTVGGAFISAGVGSFSTTAGKGHIETVGGLKLTISLTSRIAQSAGGQLVVTVGGAIVRSAASDITVASDTTRVTVGGVLDFSSSKEIRVLAAEIQLEGLTRLDLRVDGAGLELGAAAAKMRGAVQIKAGTSVVVTGKNNDLAP